MKKIILLGALYALPLVSFAQFGPIDSYFIGAMYFIKTKLVPLVFAVALLYFIWGMFLYFIKGGASPDSQKKGTQMMIWSVAGFVLMVSIWGIVNLIGSGLFGTSPQPPNLPSLPGTYNYAPPPTSGYGNSTPPPASGYGPQ